MQYTERKAARAILLTPDQQVLLMRMAFPWREHDLWILPGGGIEQGEDAQAAVIREVYEETGAIAVQVAGEAWYRESFVAATGTHLRQRYFLVPTERFDPAPADLSEAEMAWVLEYRWWPLQALEASSEMVEPVALAQGVRALIEHGLPPEPYAIDLTATDRG